MTSLKLEALKPSYARDSGMSMSPKREFLCRQESQLRPLTSNSISLRISTDLCGRVLESVELQHRFGHFSWPSAAFLLISVFTPLVAYVVFSNNANLAMGASKSKASEGGRRTTLEKHDYDLIVAQFHTVSKGKATVDSALFRDFALKYLDENFENVVFESFKKLRKDDKVGCENFVRFAELVFGDFDQMATCITLFDLPFRSVVEMLVSSFFKCEYFGSSGDAPVPTRLLVDFIVADAPKDADDITALSKWLSLSAVLPAVMSRVFNLLLKGIDRPMMPKLAHNTVLTPSAICAITLQLPAEIRFHWTLAYSSQAHGESFSKLLNAVNGVGPCLIVIETDKGSVFGGFANDGFSCGPQYSGDSRCFLFEDRLKLAIYNATGFNEDYAYLNHQQMSFPNGLGIGGRDDHWSFFLHDEFGLGTSSPSISTFEKCWLAGETRFKIRSVEAWRMGEKRKRRRYDSAGNEIIEKEISALDRDPEIKAILELTGKKTHGDAFREPPPED